MKNSLLKIVETNLEDNVGASGVAIHTLETRLKLSLPDDYKHFLSITNGLKIPSYTEPNFVETEKVDFLKNILPDLIEAYSLGDEYSVGKILEESILITEADAEQYFLLIPPTENTDWRFWKFANWLPGEYEYESLETYFQDVVEILKEEKQEQ